MKEPTKHSSRILDESRLAKLFFKPHERKIVKNQLCIHGNWYTIQDRSIANKLNGTTVSVRYDINDLSIIRLYTIEQDSFICNLEIDKLTAAVSRGKKWSQKLIFKNQKLREKLIKENLRDLVNDIDTAQIELNKLPVQFFNPSTQFEKILEIAEDQLTLAQAINRISRKMPRTRAKEKERNIARRVYPPRKNGSLRVIK